MLETYIVIDKSSHYDGADLVFEVVIKWSFCFFTHYFIFIQIAT